MKNVKILWNQLNRGTRDWILSICLALIATLGLYGSGVIASNGGVRELNLNVAMTVGGTDYIGVMNARVGRNGDYFPGVADLLLADESGAETMVRIFSLTEKEDGKYSLAYSASAKDDVDMLSKFEGEATVFPTGDGYRIVQVVTSGEAYSSGTNLNAGGVGIGSSHSTSSSKGTLTLRYYDVKVSLSGKGTITGG